MGHLGFHLLVLLATGCVLTHAKPSKSLLHEIRALLLEARQTDDECGYNKYGNDEPDVTPVDIYSGTISKRNMKMDVEKNVEKEKQGDRKRRDLQEKSSSAAGLVRLLREYLEVGKRITGGQDARQGEFPWMALLNMGCGGSILNPTTILTAAHCVLDSFSCKTEELSGITVRIGVHDSGITTSGETHTVQAVKVHPDYDCEARVVDADVALVVLSSPITYGEDVKPICLPPDGAPLPYGATCITSGFGTNVGSSSSVMQWLYLNIMPKGSCDLPKVNFCAKPPNGKVASTCHADSGSPLVCMSDDGSYYQYGVVSAGPECTNIDSPAAYTSVPAVLSWIQNNM